MLLLIKASDEQGQPLALLSGETLPEWAGTGSGADDYGGMPGKGYAKLLRDALSGEMPVVSYWRQALIAADTRLPAQDGGSQPLCFSIAGLRRGASGPRACYCAASLSRRRDEKNGICPIWRWACVTVDVAGEPATASYWPDQKQGV